MKKLLATLSVLAALWAPSALAQCNGSFNNGDLCGVSSGGPKLPGRSPASNFAGALLPTPTRAGDIIYWNGTTWVTLAGSNTVTSLLQETSAGVPSWIGQNSAANLVFPPPTRNGDIVYWNGTNWVTLPGNNSGTQTLTENSSGVPSWVATGAVSSVTIAAGQGISVTGTCTITTSGTCTVAVSLTNFSNSLGADVAMNNTANYFDGPSTAQGTTGTWLADGTITAFDTSAAAGINCKLWDGTTVIDSTLISTSGANALTAISLHGIIASPAGNIKISCKDTTSVNGVMKFNSSGNSKDSTLVVVRIQ